MLVPNRSVLLPAFLVFNLMGCAGHNKISILSPDSDTPVRIVSIFDCTINSLPSPEKFEAGASRDVIKNLKVAFKKDINCKGRVAFTSEIDAVGYGSDSLSGQHVFPENQTRSDSSSSSAHYDDSVRLETGGILHSICTIGYLCATDSLWSGNIRHVFADKRNLPRIRLLKTVTNADYCVVNSIYGTVRRKSVSAAEKIGVAIATGLLSLISPVGGVMMVPGDETIFKSSSMLINLNTGRMEWSEKFSVWKVYAVENINGDIWAGKVYRKFDIKKSLLREPNQVAESE